MEITIEYELSPQEFLDFNYDYVLHSKHIKKMRQTFLICSIVLLSLGIGVIFAFSEIELFPLVIGGIFLGIVFAVPNITKKSLQSGVKKGIYKNAYGKKKMTFFEDYFRVENEEVNTDVKYTLLEKIYKTNGYVCLSFKDNSAYIIPEKYFQNTDIFEFINGKLNSQIKEI